MPAVNSTAEKMRRIYIILRWYDRYNDWLAENGNQELSDDDKKLAIQLEEEMLELQKRALRKEKKKKR